MIFRPQPHDLRGRCKSPQLSNWHVATRRFCVIQRNDMASRKFDETVTAQANNCSRRRSDKADTMEKGTKKSNWSFQSTEPIQRNVWVE